MTIVEYVGTADTRIITQANFSSAGFTVPGGITWDKANQFRVDVADPALVAWLLAQGSTFQTEDEETFVDNTSGLLHSSGIEIGYAENVTGTVTALNTSQTDIPLVTLEIPPQTRPVWIDFCYTAQVTTTPAAGTSASLSGVITDELDVFAGFTGLPVPDVSNGQWFTVRGSARIGPVASAKTFRLQGYRGGNTAFRASAMNGNTAPVWKSWMAAYLR